MEQIQGVKEDFVREIVIIYVVPPPDEFEFRGKKGCCICDFGECYSYVTAENSCECDWVDDVENCSSYCSTFPE